MLFESVAPQSSLAFSPALGKAEVGTGLWSLVQREAATALEISGLAIGLQSTGAEPAPRPREP